MKFIFTLTTFIFSFTFFANASEIHRTFKGNVIDSTNQQPIKDCTVSFFKAQDTSLVNFVFTTPNGNYEVIITIPDSIIIVVSQMGYKDQWKRVSMSGWDWGWEQNNFKLARQSELLKEVNIRYSAIRMVKDTIEIDASRIKVLPNSDVSKLFKRIPGFEVDSKGNIKVNGAEVSKIMVDGSDFFGNNPALVSKNLRADMIEKVQVYDDKDENGVPDPNQTKTINLKLKKGKQLGVFGDALLGYGTNNRYEAGLRINSFKNDRKISFISNSNNINDEGFDFGFNNWNNENFAQRNGALSNYIIYYNSNDNESDGNINTKTNAALSYFNEFSRKRKFSIMASGLNNNYNSIYSNRIENPLSDTVTQVTTNQNRSLGNINRVKLESNFIQKFDSTGTLSFGIKSAGNMDKFNNTKQNSISTNNSIINTGDNDLEKAVDKLSSEGYFNGSIISKKNKRQRIAISLKSKINNTDENAFQFGSTAASVINLNSINNIKVTEHLAKVNGSIAYTKHWIHEFSSDVYLFRSTNTLTNKKALQNSTKDFTQDYPSAVDSLSIHFKNAANQFSFKSMMSYVTDDYTFMAGATYLNIAILNTNITTAAEVNQYYSKVLPNFQFFYWKQGKGYFGFTAERTIDFPNGNDLMPVKNISNPWYRVIGNPNLQAIEQNQVSLHFSKQNFKALKNLWSDFRINQSDNFRAFTNEIDANGITTRKPVNLTGYFTQRLNFGPTFRVTKKIELSAYCYDNYSITPELINGQKSFGKRFYVNLYPEIKYTASDWLSFEIGYGPSYTKYINTINPKLNFKQYTQSASADVTVNFWNNSEFNLTANIEDNRGIPGIGKVISLVNCSFQKPISKNEKWNLKLTAYDIFKQNVNQTRSVEGNYITISSSNQLQRFFALTLIYKLKGAQ